MNERTGRMVIEKGFRRDLGSCMVCQTEGFDDVYELDLLNQYGTGMLVRFCPRCLVELKKKLAALP